jgi:hypothetical protein
MSDLSKILVRGERARLFPVLADTSKEGRTLSIFLACLEHVDDFGRAMLAGLGKRVGKRSTIETYTEVVLQKNGEKKHRPDGLIVVKTGSTEWVSLVEAKVGNSDLTTEQVEGYLELSKQNGVDTMLTLSNQFAPWPTHHPVHVSAVARRKAELFHWSWMYVVTQASLLLSSGQIADPVQRYMLNEMVRFLTHPSAGVKSFDQMPAAWTELVSRVQAGGAIGASSPETRDVVGAWHQELRDLSLILSRQLSTEVTARISRAHAADPGARLKATMATLAKDHCLESTLVVPDAAAPIDLCADLQKRSVSVSMKLRAPAERKSTKARVTWLLRQVQRAEGSNIHVRIFWPGRAGQTQHPLATLRSDPTLAGAGREGLQALSFEVVLVKDLGARFGQRRNFISELEAAVPDFYEQVGQHLKAWQPPAPRLREEKAEPGAVDTRAMRDEAEQFAETRNAEKQFSDSPNASEDSAEDEPRPD